MAVVGGIRHKLCKGRENKDEARRRLREILTLRDLNPCLEAGPLTVAAVIEKFLEHAAKVYAERSLYERRIILQSFAELERVSELPALIKKLSQPNFPRQSHENAN
jgi:hypothetical protein